MSNEKQTATIVRHRITYWYDEYDGELIESEEEHIKNLLIEGCWCGELCFTDGDNEYRGWWEIERKTPTTTTLPWHTFMVSNKVR